MILVCVFLALFILLLLPIFAYITYNEEDGLRIVVKYIFVKVYDLSKMPEEKKKKNENANTKGKNKAIKKEKKKIKNYFPFIKPIIKVIKKIRALIRKVIVFVKFNVQICVATDDPCVTAKNYGIISAVVYGLAGKIASIFKMQKPTLDIFPDFSIKNGYVNADIIITTNLLGIILGAIPILVSFLISVIKINSNPQKE